MAPDGRDAAPAQELEGARWGGEKTRDIERVFHAMLDMWLLNSKNYLHASFDLAMLLLCSILQVAARTRDQSLVAV